MNKIKHFNRAGIKGTWLRIFSSVFVLLGFSSSVIAQYGAPAVYYKINGKVVSAKDQSPLEGINVQLNWHKDSGGREIKTDSNGNFGYTMKLHYWNERGWKLTIPDQVMNETRYFGMDSIINIDENLTWFDQDTTEIVLYLDEEEIKKRKEEIKKTRFLEFRIFRKKEENDVQVVEKIEQTVPLEELKKEDEKIDTFRAIEEKDLPESEENTNHDWKIFPNPTRTYFYLEAELEKDKAVSVWIYDVNGRLCYSEMLEKSEGITRKRIDISGFSKGTYLVCLKKEEEWSVKSLIIQ